MTDNDIKKALECCESHNCNECPFYRKWTTNQCGKLRKFVLDLINRLEKENNDLFLELEGVMWSVDKWLEGDELKQDKVNRAITMREKTLQITEKQQTEIERLEYRVEATEISKQKLLSCFNTAKTEAIKEFAREFVADLSHMLTYDKDYIKAKIFKLVETKQKEMTEGSE